jgi:hypothetical protein
MSKATDTILEIISTKGADLRQSDMEQIEELIVDIPLDDAPRDMGMIYEGIAMVVNDPLYEGDIPPIS